MTHRNNDIQEQAAESRSEFYILHDNEDVSDSSSEGYYKLSDDEYEAPNQISTYDIPSEEAAVCEKKPAASGRQGAAAHGYGSGRLLLMLLKLMGSPVEGWKELKRTKPHPEEVLKGMFAPLVALAACSCFFSLLYDITTTLPMVLTQALILFISFFVGYFAVILLERVFFSTDCRLRLDTVFGRNFVLVSLSTLAMYRTLMEALPMFGPVLVFLSLYTIYLISMGVRFLRMPRDRETYVTVALSALVIGVPLLLEYIFSLLLPSPGT